MKFTFTMLKNVIETEMISLLLHYNCKDRTGKWMSLKNLSLR